MAAQGLVGAHKLVPSVRSVTLKTESEPIVRCGKRLRSREREKGGEKERGQREERTESVGEYDQGSLYAYG